MKISAVACHGNPIHPDKEIAARFHEEFVDAMKIAVELGTDKTLHNERKHKSQLPCTILRTLPKP